MNAVVVPFMDRKTSEPERAGASRESGVSGETIVSGTAGVSGEGELSGELGASGKSGQSASLKRLEARLRGLVGKAIVDYRMVEDGDRVMACVSGGKDSHAMVHMLTSLARSAPVDFEVVAVNLDQKQPGFPAEVLPAYFASHGIAFESIEQDTYSIVVDPHDHRGPDPLGGHDIRGDRVPRSAAEAHPGLPGEQSRSAPGATRADPSDR